MSKTYLETKRFMTLLLGIWLLLGNSAYAEKYQCSFLQEKYPGGKSNQASCSMYPEDVYSSKYQTPKKYQHCNIEPVFNYEDLENVLVDLDNDIVKWTVHYGLVEHAKPEMREYYLKQGESATEAEKDVQFEKKNYESYKIVAKHTSKQRIFFDPITQKSFEPHKLMDEYNLILSDGRNTYVMYLPTSSGHAILLENTGMLENSWTRIRFGRCRKL